MNTIWTAGLVGVDAIAAAVSATSGTLNFTVNGLPDVEAREVRVRVGAACTQAGLPLRFPNVTFDIAPTHGRPADIGTRADLAVALAVAGVHAPTVLAFGELGLNGELREVRGVIPAGLLAKSRGLALLVPRAAAQEAASVPGLVVFAARNLGEAVAHLDGSQSLAPVVRLLPPPVPRDDFSELRKVYGDAVVDQLHRAAMHRKGVLLVGPAGCGKTIIARRMVDLLPPMNPAEALETANVWSALGTWRHTEARPFRAPHHTVSDAGLIGGGTKLRPGEVSLAHNGVLFLDELPEFRRSSLDTLSSLLAAGVVRFYSAAGPTGAITMPAAPWLVAAMNPCPCGFGPAGLRCTCRPAAIAAYEARVERFARLWLPVRIELPAVVRAVR